MLFFIGVEGLDGGQVRVNVNQLLYFHETTLLVGDEQQPERCTRLVFPGCAELLARTEPDAIVRAMTMVAREQAELRVSVQE
jgi:hypothetical protein